jgi:hypothetical protein
MVRMGRRFVPAGAQPQTSSSGGVHARPAVCLEGRRPPLPEICQTDLYAVSRCGPPAVATPRRRSGGTGRRDELIVVGAQPASYARTGPGHGVTWPWPATSSGSSGTTVTWSARPAPGAPRSPGRHPPVSSWPGRTRNASRHLRYEVCATSARRAAHPLRWWAETQRWGRL